MVRGSRGQVEGVEEVEVVEFAEAVNWTHHGLSVRTVVRTPSLTLPTTARTAGVYLQEKSGPSPCFRCFKKIHEFFIDFMILFVQYLPDEQLGVITESQDHAKYQNQYL